MYTFSLIFIVASGAGLVYTADCFIEKLKNSIRNKKTLKWYINAISLMVMGLIITFILLMAPVIAELLNRIYTQI